MTVRGKSSEEEAVIDRENKWKRQGGDSGAVVV